MNQQGFLPRGTSAGDRERSTCPTQKHRIALSLALAQGPEFASGIGNLHLQDLARSRNSLAPRRPTRGAKGWHSWPFSGIDLVLWGIAGNHARWPVYQMLRDTTKEKIPAYFTGFALEKAPAFGFRNFKIPIREDVGLGREGAAGSGSRAETVGVHDVRLRGRSRVPAHEVVGVRCPWRRTTGSQA